jgi:hypothetical protein
VWYASWDVIVALVLALFVNAAILIVSAASFYDPVGEGIVMMVVMLMLMLLLLLMMMVVVVVVKVVVVATVMMM